MAVMWRVELAPKARRSVKRLSVTCRQALAQLVLDLVAEGPVRSEWAHYGQLKHQKGQKPTEKRYHCHIQSGRQTVVACWRVNGNEIKIEVYFVGSHGDAPY
jgi:mRNA-degrading endonuclease RelE of RelBE toxin-antitoxin system